MIKSLSALLLLGLGAVLSIPAQAFTPESGWWWNPDEPGVGYNIEIQDNYMYVAAYTYTATGNPRQATFFTAQGVMQNNTTFQTNEVNTFQNGTCPTCNSFTRPQVVPATGSLRPFRIVFDDQTTGRLTWGSANNMHIERFDFYLTGADPQISPKTELMLGEWQIVMDFLDFGYAGSPFYGEVLVFDSIAVNDGGGTTDFYDGCRPFDSLEGRCFQEDYDDHDASGFFCPQCGGGDADKNLIFVKDGFESTWNQNAFLVFEVNVGTYKFDGYAKLCRQADINPPRDVFAHCLDNHAEYPVIPVRGWRTASRAFVQGNNNAPNATTDDLKREGERLRNDAGQSRYGSIVAGAPAGGTKAATVAEPRSAAASAMVRESVQRILSRQAGSEAE